jgi:hypothetical protein
MLRSLVRAPAFRVHLNAAEDTEHAHKVDGFDNVLHIFHEQWIGIRAAAGSLPGQKLAISTKGRIGRSGLRAFFDALKTSRAERFVVHGMSANAAYLIRRMAEAGLSQQVYIVYHGNVAQWYFEPERKLAFEAIDLVRSGCVKRIHFMKRNHDMVEGKSYAPMLLNMSPVVSTKASENSHSSGIAFMPGTNEWRKNLHCNALGAAMSPRVSTVLHYAKDVRLPSPHSEKLRHIRFVNRRSTLELMTTCMMTLYVSLVECHPMVNLESESIGIPCLRGPLNIDVLEDHPYVVLVRVSDPSNPFEIRDCVVRVADVPAAEIRELISDYLHRVNKTSLERYREFLEI